MLLELRQRQCYPIVSAQNMEQPCEVPLCPPGPESPIARHLRVNGWRWDDELLGLVVTKLAQEDVYETKALVGLDLDDVPDSANWPQEVRVFMQTAVSCLRHAALGLCWALSLDRSIRQLARRFAT
jgi:hypothetical protein